MCDVANSCGWNEIFGNRIQEKVLILKKYLVSCLLDFSVLVYTSRCSLSLARRRGQPPSFLNGRKESARVRARSATHDGVTQLIVPLLV